MFQRSGIGTNTLSSGASGVATVTLGRPARRNARLAGGTAGRRPAASRCRAGAARRSGSPAPDARERQLDRDELARADRRARRRVHETGRRDLDAEGAGATSATRATPSAEPSPWRPRPRAIADDDASPRHAAPSASRTDTVSPARGAPERPSAPRPTAEASTRTRRRRRRHRLERRHRRADFYCVCLMQ